MRYSMVAVDFLNLAHRVYHTSGDLSTRLDNGPEVPIGMVYGFIRSCVKLYDEISAPGARFILCDEGESTARKAIWSDYKKDRTGHRPDFESQLELLRDLVSRLGWMRATSPGWEGDDVVATIASTWSGYGKTCAIVTADHDLHQCVTDRVHIVDPGKAKKTLMDGQAWRLRDVDARWGVPPEKIPQVKALCGDSSDGYPGITGIGDKLAVSLIKTFGDLDTVLAQIMANKKIEFTWWNPPYRPGTKGVERWRADVPMVPIYLDLATVRRDVDLEFAPRAPEPNPIEEFRRFRFSSLTARSTLNSCLAMAGIDPKKRSG